jgi:hypothetical protein
MSNLDGIDADMLPPSTFIAGTVKFAVMAPAKRCHEFIAHLAAQRAWLREAEVVGIGWLSPTDEARLLGHEPQVVLIAVAAGLGNRKDALVYTRGRNICGGRCGLLRRERCHPRANGLLCSCGIRERREPMFECFLNALGVGCGQAVLGFEAVWRPARCDVDRLKTRNFTEESIP